jgi:hypothetical protein
MRRIRWVEAVWFGPASGVTLDTGASGSELAPAPADIGYHALFARQNTGKSSLKAPHTARLALGAWGCRNYALMFE